MMSTSVKIAVGYVLLVLVLIGSVIYIYGQMSLLTSPLGMEENLNRRRQATHQIISQLYDAEIIGQTVRVGNLHDFPRYKRAMDRAGSYIDTLQVLLTDTLQQTRLDTVRRLLRRKERNMISVLEAMGQTPTDRLYLEQLDSLLKAQDSIPVSTHVRRKVVTHHNSYTIHHKKKGFFKRVAAVFAPDKEDSTQVNDVVQEEYIDTVREVINPADTIAGMLSGIQGKVFRTQQEQMKTLNARIMRLRVAGTHLSRRVNELLESIEQAEQEASVHKFTQEQEIRHHAAYTIGVIATVAVILTLVCFLVVWRDITRSNHYRHELEKSKLYAENLLVAREKLMLTITHDIKAPAGSIIGYIDLLVRLVHDKRQQFYLGNMKSSARHLLDLVTSLLDYHRLEAGKMDLQNVAFNPRQLFDDIYNSFVPLAEKKGLQLKLENRKFAPRLALSGDPFRIRQIADNLLSNALKFTAEGSITLCTWYYEGRLTFKVSDTGCGMTLDEQKRIFHEFMRLQSAKGQEGFGLGLSITRKLVELLQGDIHVESAPGKGSTFTVSLPLATIHPDEQPEETGGSPADDKGEMPPLRLLLIDDDRIQNQLTEAMLHNLSDAIEVHTCEQPEELFKLLHAQTFDKIFTDIQMPGMNGFELLKAIRRLDVPQAKTVPVIAITARSDMHEEDFRVQGFSGCLHKPFNQSDLAAILSPTQEVTVKPAAPHAGTSPEGYDLDALTAFSADDAEAARGILRTFATETEHNAARIEQALAEKDMATLSSVAHKMLPTFTMIKASEALADLRSLEARRDNPCFTEQARLSGEHILDCARRVLAQCRARMEA